MRWMLLYFDYKSLDPDGIIKGIIQKVRRVGDLQTNGRVLSILSLHGSPPSPISCTIVRIFFKWGGGILKRLTVLARGQGFTGQNGKKGGGAWEDRNQG